MTKRKPNIRPDLVGELFLKPGEDIPYRLILCNTEPTAQIQRVDTTTPDDLVGISGLSGLVLLKPVKPIVITTRRKRPASIIEEEPLVPAKKEVTPEVANEKGPPDISTFTISIGQEGEDHRATLGNKTVKAETLKECVEALLTFHGIDRKYIEDAPDSGGKQQLIGILNAGQEKGGDADGI